MDQLGKASMGSGYDWVSDFICAVAAIDAFGLENNVFVIDKKPAKVLIMVIADVIHITSSTMHKNRQDDDFGMSVQESNRVVVIQWDWEAGRYKKAQIMVLGIEKFFQPFPAPTAAFLFLLFLARTRWEERSASGGRNPRTALFWTISSWLVRWAVGLGLRGDNSSWAGLVGLYVLVLGSA